MKILLISFFMMSSALASINTNIAVTSDYLWRGQSQTATTAAVQGTLEYSDKWLTVGSWLSSLGGDNNGAEVDLYVTATHEFSSDYSLALSVVGYTYAQDTNLNFIEYILTFTNPVATFMVANTSDYVGSETSSMYYNLSKSFTLDSVKKIGLNLSVGMTTFDEEEKAGSKNYTDYKIALTKEKEDMTYEFFFSNTDRKKINEDTTETNAKDATVGVSLTLSL